VPHRPVPFLDFTFAEAHRFAAERAFAHLSILPAAAATYIIDLARPAPYRND